MPVDEATLHMHGSKRDDLKKNNDNAAQTNVPSNNLSPKASLYFERNVLG